ncbi:MAG: hypothetical protein GOVbin3661_41 [Prokaryotic dsDNA virus sp.]|nr:MAG: hypothetical protein GOVbin3661_41 [Prokaryotic dsDNA virus sp.]|tara:strand:- start:8664 stop:9065 length:402 start_codon:yes stop_codon:yes gene_type:complete
MKKTLILVLFFFISFNYFTQEVSAPFNAISYNYGTDSIYTNVLPGSLHTWYEDGYLVQEWPGETIYFPVELVKENDNTIYFNSRAVVFKQGVKFIDYIYDKSTRSLLINNTCDNPSNNNQIKFHEVDLKDLGY